MIMRVLHVLLIYILSIQIQAQTYYIEYDHIRSINYMEFVAKS